MPPVLRYGLPFFLNAIILSSWMTRIPDLKADLGIGTGDLGLALFALPFGTLIALPLAGPVIDRLSNERAYFAGALAGLAMLVAIGAAGSWTALTLALFGLGLANALMEVAMNVAAADAEHRIGVRIMSRCHGFWSIGMMSGGLVSGVIAQAGISTFAHLTGIALVGTFAAIALARLPAEAGARMAAPAPKAEGGHTFTLPGRAIIGLCLLAAGVTVAEGAMFDWSTLYLRRDLGAEPFMAGLGYALFAGSQATTRFLGDVLRRFFRPEHLVLGSGLVTSLGLVGVALSSGPLMTYPFLMMLGAGVALVYPVASSVVTLKPGRSPAANVAGLTLVVMIALLTAPPLIGLIADGFGLRVAFLAIVPAALLTVLLAGHAREAARITVVA